MQKYVTALQDRHKPIFPSREVVWASCGCCNKSTQILWLKTHTFIFFWRSEVQKKLHWPEIKVLAGMCSLWKFERRILCLASSSIWRLFLFLRGLGPTSHHLFSPFPLSGWLFFFCHQISLCLPCLISTLVMHLGPTQIIQNNLRNSRCNHIYKALLLYKVTVTGSHD